MERLRRRLESKIGHLGDAYSEFSKARKKLSALRGPPPTVLYPVLSAAPVEPTPVWSGCGYGWYVEGGGADMFKAEHDLWKKDMADWKKKHGK